jgi:hypothetical protein
MLVQKGQLKKKWTKSRMIFTDSYIGAVHLGKLDFFVHHAKMDFVVKMHPTVVM